MTDTPSTSVVLVYAGPAWDRTQPIYRQRNAPGHMRHMRDQVASGVAIIAGPMHDVTGKLEGDLLGVVIYDRPVPEATKIANADPAVVGGQLRIEVRPFYRVTV
ncbi:YciI family protein [Salinispora arenicola]|uniref:YciI family protein n=1 Tax=Salinispora arenicola TaxID=168697 RepID=UPI001E303032|nr:YciI family protein [Salinispora arenicola]